MHELARQAAVKSPALEAIRERLDFPTMQLGQAELHEVFKMIWQVENRITCELWGHKMGWDIPTYPSPEWDEMQRAWLETE